MSPRDEGLVSKCHGALLRTSGGTTRHFVCAKCGKACDGVPKHATRQKNAIAICPHSHESQKNDGYKTCRWCFEDLYAPKSALVPPERANMRAGATKAAGAPSSDVYARIFNLTPKMSKTESKYRLLLLTEFPDVRFEAITFKMRNGHRYTPDFLCANADGDILEFHEVKGSYRLHSHSRARLAFDQCRAEYGMFKFVWAVQNKGGGFDVSEPKPESEKP